MPLVDRRCIFAILFVTGWMMVPEGRAIAQTVVQVQRQTPAAAPTASIGAIVGTWRCPLGTMQISPSTYVFSGEPATRIRSIVRRGHDYRVIFSRERSVTLLGVNLRSLTWHSPKTGDTFDCTRTR